MTPDELWELEELENMLEELEGPGEPGKKKSKKYEELVHLKIDRLEGKAKKFGKAYKEYFKASYTDCNEKDERLKEVLFQDKNSMQELLDDGLAEYFYKLLPEDMAKKHCEILLRQQKYIYNHSSYRRSFRSKELEPYYFSIICLMRSVYFNWYDFDLEAYLMMGDDEIKAKGIQSPDSFMVSHLIALEIDQNNQTVIDAAKEIILSDNNVRMVDHTFVRGIAKCHNKEIQNLLMKLLLAAKLQEGLRQVIFETADDGTISYFKLVIKTILEHNLLRFSSCIRAVDVWMGLGYDYSDQRIITKLLTLGSEYMSDEKARLNAIESHDSLEMYCAMWAESVYGIDQLTAYVIKYASGEKYQKLTAFYFLNQLNSLGHEIRLAAPYLEETDLDVLAWILACYNLQLGWCQDKKSFVQSCQSNAILADENERKSGFDSLIKILERIPKEGYKVSKKPFDWCCITIERSDIYRKLLVINGYQENAEDTKRLIDLASYAASDQRVQLLNYFVEPDRSQVERAFLFESLSDKSMPVRIAAAKILRTVSMNEEELIRTENLLSLKTGEIRQIVLEIIKNKDKEEILRITKRLISDKNVNKRLGALDVLNYLLDKSEIDPDIITSFIKFMPKVTEQEQVLIHELIREDAQQYTSENGYGLYDVSYRPVLPSLRAIPEYTLEAFRNETDQTCISIINSLINVIRENKDYTFTWTRWDGSETEAILGNLTTLMVSSEHGQAQGPGHVFDQFVLSDVWRRWVKQENVSLLTLNKIRFAKKLAGYSAIYEPQYEKWAVDFLGDTFGKEELQTIAKYLKEQEFGALAGDILERLSCTYEEREVFEFSYGILSDFISKTGADWKKAIGKSRYGVLYSTIISEADYYLKDSAEIQFFINELDRVREGEAFVDRLSICYEIGRLSGIQFTGLDEIDIARAVTRGIVDVNELYRIFFKQEPTRKIMRYTGELPASCKEIIEQYPIIKTVCDDVVQRVIDIEVKRGDTKTEVSHIAQAVRGHYGIENFVDILLALGSETLTRGYIYAANYNKKDVLSSLLKVSKPNENDSAALLKDTIKDRISDKRILEAAMYAPSWISIVEEYLGWRGLKSAAWYFHAHTNDGVSAEFETETARFSPLSREEFMDGAFDINWFQSAYKMLKAERFELLYRCAKYISSGGSHRRAQLFADAVLGKLDLEETEAKIKDKRNKDLLLSYSLIPLGRSKLKVALRRYEFIQEFLKESKKFGAQRRASEGKVCEIALGNLARNLGYDDTLRFSWKMEVLKLKELQSYFNPHQVEDCTLYIDINSTDIVIEKNGKRLKSIPAKLKKNSYVEELKGIRASLKEQFKRARSSFEKAMENQDQIPFGELLDLLEHPVIQPIVTKLVFLSGEHVGFLTKDGLAACNGKVQELDKKAPVMVAHCYHLYESGKWREFQRYAFENQLVQPFKQIFRELYLINEDEKKEKSVSRRYAGNQIQTKKTAALLKSRSWTVDYTNGLQKVYYKENIIAAMYALADWYSPSEVEAPTLETVMFRDRNTYKTIEFEQVSQVIFSEIMRDVDLVVSVAHVGGVDPMTSHSTIEMRGVIVEEIIRLMKLSNVIFAGSHAKITGTKGEYSVHLGSGVTHMMGRGALNILPVHSQHRGKIFLPFVDEDPKTAEILSKVLLLAEDQKIKDATILSQIV